jgi:carboxymethylenebutenolidase
MRYLFLFALAACLTVAGLSLQGIPLFADSATASDYASALWQIHRSERPLPTAILAQSPASSTPVAGETVTYGSLEGKPLEGYLARPTESQQPLPALIVIHEWWGLNDNIKAMTRKLAAEGYTALAVDLYEGQVAGEPEKARELVTAALQSPERLQANLREAYHYLERQPSPKIGVIGWCFGGTWSLNTALLFPEQLAAAVIYYGGQLETNPARLKSLQVPILGIFGELDQRPSVEAVRQFEAALQSLGKAVEIYIYPNADHAFANPSGERYNPQAAAAAWKQTQQFLARYLK